jgi:alkanesulfonate monooxygenase SsuD/methylene tetrahydromethanopterin reductase-like flavin-dependent oxidoreductase (luciferase family)
MLRHAGVTAVEINVVRDQVQRLGLARAAAALDDTVARKVVIAGTPDEVVEGLRKFLPTGLKLPIIWEIIGPERQDSLGLIAQAIMPKLR